MNFLCAILYQISFHSLGNKLKHVHMKMFWYPVTVLNSKCSCLAYKSGEFYTDIMLHKSFRFIQLKCNKACGRKCKIEFGYMSGECKKNLLSE